MPINTRMMAMMESLRRFAPTEGLMDWKLSSWNDGHWAVSSLIYCWCTVSLIDPKTHQERLVAVIYRHLRIGM